MTYKGENSDPILKIKDLHQAYGEKIVLNHVNLEIYPGEFVALVGPSGCGKSTLFRAILGTHLPTAGAVWTGSVWKKDFKRIDGPSRDIGIVYQHYALYDFLTAQENVAFGMLLDKTDLFQRLFYYFRYRRLYKKFLVRSQKMLDRVGLGKHANSYPRALSGGMRQRVAIAQAIIMRPRVLLLDEPFGALDEATREDLQKMLLQFYAENQSHKEHGDPPPHTIILVTHELNEAFYICDRVVGLSQYHNKGFPGATIVYDQPAPVFKPTDPKTFSVFLEQKEQLRKIVFDGILKANGDEYIKRRK
jgi:NitT/TauT family transport system ATP-binding protein